MIKSQLEKYKLVNILFVVLTCIFFFFVVYLNLAVKSEQQFVYLAKSFLAGKTYFIDMPSNTGDMALFNGKYYWSNPPFPAILLLPFVFLSDVFGLFFYQGFLQIILVFGTLYLIFRIAKHFKYQTFDALVLAFAFCFSSVYLGVAMWPWSWFFAHVVATFFTLLAINEFNKKRRLWLIGVCFAAILLTRTVAALGIIFYLLNLLFDAKSSPKTKFTNIAILLFPLVVATIFLGFYNHTRFGKFTEFGYLSSLLPPFHAKAREYGIFNPVHIPGNIYYLFFSSPTPVFKDDVSHVLKFPFIKNNPWGMGIFITSPYLLYLFFLKYKDKLSKFLLATVFLTLIPVLLFFGIGFRQFGFRYSLDFLPYLFLLFLVGYRQNNEKLSSSIKILIVFSAYLNLHLFIFGFLR